MLSLSPRQQSILNRVVETHIETAQPVGSRFLTDLYTGLYHDSYSPATVRAEMGLLEDRGYLTHPHPSAGRIPTDQGYRYYVDHGLKEEKPSEELVRRMNHELSGAAEEMETFAENVSRILSKLTGEVSLIIVSDRLFFQGSSRMLEKPEFQDLNKVRPILQKLEEKVQLAAWFSNRAPQEGVTVTIGRENETDAFQCCSLISARYEINGKYSGTVAVLGPQRMCYSKSVPLVAQMGKIIQRVLENYES